MDKIALITGASKGIGKEFAYIFARNGYSLILVARSADELAALQSEIKTKYQRDVKILAIDLSLPESIDHLYATFKEDMPQIEVLVNNAAFGKLSKFSEMDAEDVRGMVELNVAALTKLTYKILPHMIARKNGKILNIASTASFAPGPYMAMYFATKAYVLSYSEALHEECKEDGITVSVLCPGPTVSEFSKRSGSDKSEMTDAKKMMSTESVVEIGYAGLMRGKRVIISGFANKVNSYLMWLIPHFISMKLIAKEIRTPKSKG